MAVEVAGFCFLASSFPSVRALLRSPRMIWKSRSASIRGGSKPGERRGGRQKGSLNKLSIGRMKAQVATRAPEFDPYDQLEIIAKTFLERARTEQSRDKPNMSLVDDLLDKAARVIRDMMPYKRPRLAAVKVSGDKDAPLFDLTQLTDSELAFLRRTVLKAQRIAEEGG